MLDRLTYLIRYPLLRIIYALTWTTISLVLLLQSSAEPMIGPPAPPGAPPPDRELLLFVGHVVVFSIMTGLWWWAFLIVSPPKRSLVIAVSSALLIGGVTEILQVTTPSREPSIEDLATNWLVTTATAWLILTQFRRVQRLNRLQELPPDALA